MQNENIKEAKNSLKAHIKFFQALLSHIRSEQEPFMSRAMWATWCLHRYINDKLMTDIEEAIKKHGAH